MSDSGDSYGPALPPGMQQADENTSSDNDQYGPVLPKSAGDSNESVTNKDCRGPVLPMRRPESGKEVIGPFLPANYKRTSADSSDSDSDSSSSSSSSTSSLHHRLRRKKKHKRSRSSQSVHIKESHIIGPAMPAFIGQSSDALGVSDSRGIGPSLPPSIQGSKSERTEDSDDDVIGPSLGLKASEEDQSAVKDFESRSQRMKEQLTSSVKPDKTEVQNQRESWMTELPEEMGASFGLSNRQFRTRDAPEIDSSWTEAPHEKGKKIKDGKKRKKDKDGYFQSDKDKKAKKEIEAYNKKHRPESLLEMHKKEMKKKKKKEKKKSKSKQKERRPFDRDVDLKVNKFDDAMKKAYIKRTQELGSRFQSGGTGTSFL